MTRALMILLLAAAAPAAQAEPLDRSALREARNDLREARRSEVRDRCDPAGAQTCADARAAFKDGQPDRIARRDERRTLRRTLWAD